MQIKIQKSIDIFLLKATLKTEIEIIKIGYDFEERS